MCWARCFTHPLPGQHQSWLLSESAAVCSPTVLPWVGSCHRNIYSYKLMEKTMTFLQRVPGSVKRLWQIPVARNSKNIRAAKDAQKKVDVVSKGSVLGCCLANSRSASLPWNVLIRQFSWQQSFGSYLLLTDVMPAIGGTGLKEGGAGRSTLPVFLSCALILLGTILLSSETKQGTMFLGDPKRDPK